LTRDREPSGLTFEVFGEIAPVRVKILDRRLLPVPPPPFDGILSRKGCLAVVMVFIPDEAVAVIARGEALLGAGLFQVRNVLTHTVEEVFGVARVEDGL